MACSSTPSLSVLAAMLLSLGIALVLPQLVVCVATMTHSKGPQNFDPSLSTLTLTYEYKVFVSFRGANIHTSFTAYLFHALDRKRIVAYRDDIDLPRREEIGPELLKVNETSRIVVVVLIKNYANSDWCLDELVKIMECKTLLNQMVLPIFYYVSASMVRNQIGNCAEAILNGPEEKVNIWKATLTNVANLAGLHLNPYCSGPEFIEEIVQSIWNILRATNPKETNSSRSLAPPYLATKACSSGPSLSVLAAFLWGLGIALVLPQLVVRVATMTHFKGPTLTYEYDVFVSFRGADTRTRFTAYLFDALACKRVVAYRDDRNLPRGGEIGPELLKAIETSRIAVVVFSKSYATSDWCLDELVKIMECKRVFNQSVLPIFYDVSQSVVLEQKGVFAEALLNGPVDKVNNWRTAMTEAANLSGFHLEHRPEPEFIEEIVEIIWKILYEESPTSTIPPCRQIDVPGQCSSLIIPPKGALSGQTAIAFAERTHLFFFWLYCFQVQY